MNSHDDGNHEAADEPYDSIGRRRRKLEGRSVDIGKNGEAFHGS